MLVLSRKIGERIIIGGEIALEVVEIRGATVRLGIVAPRDISVHREEVAQLIRESGRASIDGAMRGG